MKKNLILSVLLFISCASFSQAPINLKDAAAHAGDSVLVCGKIFTTRYFADSKDPITLLNMGAAFPNQQLTVLITAEARKEFKEAPENFFKDKSICVTGKVIIYKDKPEIIIYHQEQLMEAMDGK